jgi:hypothetical protein
MREVAGRKGRDMNVQYVMNWAIIGTLATMAIQKTLQQWRQTGNFEHAHLC